MNHQLEMFLLAKTEDRHEMLNLTTIKPTLCVQNNRNLCMIITRSPLQGNI